MPNIKIIKGTKEHIDSCEQILHNSILTKKYFSKPGSGRKQIVEGIENNNILIALADEEVLGFMYLIPCGVFHSFPYLHLFVVKEGYRGKGIGSKMLEYLESILGGTQLFLLCADFNIEARHFYEQHGFEKVTELAGLYKTGINECLMRKTINIEGE